MPDTFGERAATEDEVSDWVTLVNAGRAAATDTMRVRDRSALRRDRIRPIYGSGQASHEGDE